MGPSGVSGMRRKCAPASTGESTSVVSDTCWKLICPAPSFGTALPVANEGAGQINFQQVSLTTLVDSPVLAGAHFRRIPLTPEGPIQHYIDEVSDGDAALQMPEETIQHYKNLIAETGALFQARHYRDYHFLLTLSDNTAHFGLEHH